jgi:transposase
MSPSENELPPPTPSKERRKKPKPLRIASESEERTESTHDINSPRHKKKKRLEVSSPATGTWISSR